MKTDKRNQILDRLYPALHTLSGYADVLDMDVANAQVTIPKRVGVKDGKYVFVMNPNNAVTKYDMVRNWSMFKQVLDFAVNECSMSVDDGAVGFRVNRVDMSFNSDDEDFNKYQKYFRLFALSVGKGIGAVNRYASYDPLTMQTKNTAIKSRRFEIENYNRDAKNKETHKFHRAKNRIQIRSKHINILPDEIPEIFTGEWTEILRHVQDYYDCVCADLNQALVQRWENGRFNSMSEFFRVNSDYLYSRKQMIDLVDAIGSIQSKKWVDRFQERHHIETYSKTDIRLLSSALIQKTNNYFSS